MSAAITLPLIALIITLDQFIKFWAINNLKNIETMTIIPGVLNLTYVENYGAAFGMMRGMRWVLIALTAGIICAALYAILSRKIESRFLNISITLITAGGLGNLIDRIRLGYVVDYLDINELFRYPMFNLADCCVVVGAVFIVVYVLFFEGKHKKDTHHKGQV